MEYYRLPRVRREIKQCKQLNGLRKRGRLVVDPNTLGIYFLSAQSDSLACNIITTHGPDNVVSIVTRHGLDGPVFEPQWKIRDFLFSKPVHVDPGSQPAT